MKLVIFDLDGTLLNTIEDLAEATNYGLQKLGFQSREISLFNQMVGNGINKLFERALPDGAKSDENIALLRSHFVEYYTAHNTDKTKPYEGVDELLVELKSRGVRLAVASNKYQSATDTLISHYFKEYDFEIVLGQREGITPKPNPQIVYDIIEYTKVDKSDIIYIGDSGVDMQTARNAGVMSIGCSWGLRSKEELRDNGADVIIDRPLDMLAYICNK